MKTLMLSATVTIFMTVFMQNAIGAEGKATKNFPFFSYLTGSPVPKMVAYSPSELDPQFKANHQRLTTDSIRLDLKALRSVFDGFVLYGYNKDSTPRIIQEAKELKFRAVLLGIWDPRSNEEIDGVADLVNQYHKEISLGVVVGNEGLTFRRYEPDDLNLSADRLLSKIPQTVPVTTSEPLTMSLNSGFVKHFGDFLAPNIHPVWDRPDFSPEKAAAWTREQAIKLAQKAGKPVLVKETGFPHDGKEGYTPETQKAFWLSYLKQGVITYPTERADVWVFYGVAFEAFDLPWKAIATNIPIEKSWGLFSTDRHEYPALSAWRTVVKVNGR